MSFVQNYPFFSIVLSLLCAVVSFVVPARWGKRLTYFLLCASLYMQTHLLVFCAAGHVSFSYMMGHYPAPWGNEVAAGIIEPLMALLFVVVILLSISGGGQHIAADIKDDRQNLYWVMVDLAHVSLMALCYTNDIFTGYVFIEICTIASCALLCIRENGRALIASVRYMVFALIGSGLFLIGVIYTYAITGHLLFPQLYDAIQALWAEGTYRFSMTAAIGLMTAGLAIKSGLFPFHFWMPDTYGRATPASSGILSGVVSKGYIFLLIKVIYRVIGADIFAASGVQTVLLLFGIGGMIVGSVSAILSRRITTMVAFSSAAQIGYVFMGLGMGGQAALAAVFFQILSHALTKPMLFLASRDLSEAAGGHEEFRYLRGAAHRNPIAGAAFTVGALSMVGVPVFAGFIPKLYFATASFGMGWRTWAVLLALAVSTVLNVLYFLYTAMVIWMPGTSEQREYRTERTAHGIWAMVVFVVLNVAVGLSSTGIAALLTQGFDLFCR
ncbi:MAG: proton-conducting transporter membrane subunit [Eubacteriales bacterium]|nr:proton-conducting transporter membrane subunit [Eubacteriales bacterium]